MGSRCGFVSPSSLRLPDYPHGVEDLCTVTHKVVEPPELTADQAERLERFCKDSADALAVEVDPGEEEDEEAADAAFQGPGNMSHELKCRVCKQKVTLASKFLLVWPGGPGDTRRIGEVALGGALQGVCQGCANVPDFDRQQKSCWRRYSACVKNKARRTTRGLTIATVRKELANEYPGMRYQEINTKCAERLATMCMAFMVSFLQDPGFAAMSRAVYNEFKQSAILGVHDLSHAGRAHDQASWARFEAGASSDYLTQLSSCCLVAYMCRKCLFYGSNALWITHRAKYWFRCPRCYEHYKMGTESSELHSGRRVCALFNPLRRSWWAFPASFGDADAAAWIRNQCVAYLRAQTPAAKGAASTVAGAAGSLGRLSAALERLGQPSLFQNFPFSEAGATDRGLAGNWKWQHLTHGGVWGKHLTDEEAATPIFTEWSYLIELVGGVCLSGQAIAARL